MIELCVSGLLNLGNVMQISSVVKYLQVFEICISSFMILMDQSLSTVQEHYSDLIRVHTKQLGSKNRDDTR